MNDNNTKILKVSGKNLDSFFQNLITNDVSLLTHQKIIYTCVLTPQGKFLNDFFLTKKNSSYLIEINENEIESFTNLLKHYDLRNNCNVEEVKNLKTLVCLEKKYDQFQKLFKDNIENFTECFEIFEDPRSKGYLLRIWIKKDKADEIAKAFAELDQNEIEVERIKRLIPNSQIDLEKNKSFILAFGLDKLNAISFDKGCFVGQENTARQKYRGNQKYILRSLKLLEGSFPSFNDELKLAGQRIGIMKSSRGDYGLALIKNDIKKSNNETYEICNSTKVLFINHQ